MQGATPRRGSGVLGLVATHVELAHDAELDLTALAEWEAGKRQLETQPEALHVAAFDAKHGHGLDVPFDSAAGILLGERDNAQAPLSALRTARAVWVGWIGWAVWLGWTATACLPGGGCGPVPLLRMTSATSRARRDCRFEARERG